MFLKYLILTLLVSHQCLAATDKVVCFFASWAGYRNGQGSYKPENIDPHLCTHLNYAFLGVASDGSLQILDSWNEVDLMGLSKTASLKTINPDLKVLVSIGGWNAGNELLAGIVASATLRANLVASALSFFKQWNFDGLDIAWEFPLDAQRPFFVLLLQELKAAFEPSGYVLSVTASATPTSAYDVPAISDAVDLINLMTYDYHTAYDGVTGHNSPAQSNDELNINYSVSSWLLAGADRSKVTFSIPFYGHSFSLSTSANGVGAPAGPGISGPFSQSPGMLGYNEICSFISSWTRVWDTDAQVPYLVNGNDWISYDDELSVTLKVIYAKTSGLAGIAIWSIDTDDFNGACGTKNALLAAINNNL